MADRYWVGGTGNWDANTTNWSATSGGAGGASVPTLADAVFFNSASNATAYVVTLLTAPVCRSVSVVGPATGNVTIAGSVTWSIYGSMTLAATGVTWTNTSTINFRATTTGWTITTNGVSLSNGIIFNGAGGGWTLGSALTNTSASGATLTQGAFATANFNVTVTGGFASTGALTRSLTLGSSAISFGSWNALGATNLTLNANTSTITITGAAGTFNGGGLTYYNVTRTSSAAAALQIGDANNTFNAVSVTNTSGYGTLLFTGNQTIGTLTANGNALIAPNRIISSVIGTQITLTVASFVTNGFINFRDINFAGAALPITVSTGGDLGNNSNITLATPKTIYWSLVAGGNWTATAWALTSGGTPATANFPLAQDTIIIEDTGLNSGATITMNLGSFIGNMSMSTRTLPMTWAIGSQAVQNYGNLTLSSAVTTTATTGTLNFLGFNKTQTITSAGVSFASSLTVNSPTLTVALAGALTTTATVTLTFGTLNLANNNLTCNLFLSDNLNTRVITFGTGQIYATGFNAIVINISNMTGFTYTGSGTFNATYSGGAGGHTCIFGFASGATESNALNINRTAGSDVCAVYGAGIRSLNFTGYSGNWVPTGGQTLYGDLTLSATMTVTSTGNLFFAASSGIQNITTNGKTTTFPIIKNGAGTLRLVDALTMGSTLTFTHNVGTVDLNNLNLTCGIFSSSNSNLRTLAFGTGNITVTGNNATVWNTGLSTNLTFTGTPIVNSTYSGATGTRTITVGAVSNVSPDKISLNVSSGSDTVTTGGTSSFINLNFTGFSGTLGNSAKFIYGNLIFSSSMTLTAGTLNTTFSALSGTQQITTAGKTLDFPLSFNGTGGTFAFQDALTQGSTRAFTITNGTVQLKDSTTNIVGVFTTSGTNQKFLESTLANTQATLSQASGTVNASYLSIKDINATGGAMFYAYGNNSNIDRGNNTGWDFGILVATGFFFY